MPKDNGTILISATENFCVPNFRAAIPAWIRREWEFTCQELQIFLGKRARSLPLPLYIKVYTTNRHYEFMANGKVWAFESEYRKSFYMALELRRLFQERCFASEMLKFLK